MENKAERYQNDADYRISVNMYLTNLETDMEFHERRFWERYDVAQNTLNELLEARAEQGVNPRWLREQEEQTKNTQKDVKFLLQDILDIHEKWIRTCQRHDILPAYDEDMQIWWNNHDTLLNIWEHQVSTWYPWGLNRDVVNVDI